MTCRRLPRKYKHQVSVSMEARSCRFLTLSEDWDYLHSLLHTPCGYSHGVIATRILENTNHHKRDAWTHIDEIMNMPFDRQWNHNPVISLKSFEPLLDILQDFNPLKTDRTHNRSIKAYMTLNLLKLWQWNLEGNKSKELLLKVTNRGWRRHMVFKLRDDI